MDKKYRVIFLSLVESLEDFEHGMSRLGVAHPMVEQILHKAPVILKGGMNFDDAKRYADAVEHAGGRVKIQEHDLFEEGKQANKMFDIKPLESFTMCPECGFKQLKGEACVKCGLAFSEGEAGRG